MDPPVHLLQLLGHLDLRVLDRVAVESGLEGDRVDAGQPPVPASPEAEALPLGARAQTGEPRFCGGRAWYAVLIAEVAHLAPADGGDLRAVRRRER